MKKDKYVFEELVGRKPYLKEENYCPNVGIFEYGKSKNVDKILYGSNVYRYDIYKYRDDDERIRNLGGGDPIKYKTYKYVKKDISKFLTQNKLNLYPHTTGDEKVKNKLKEYLESIDIKNVLDEELIITSSTTHAYSLILKSILRKYDVVIIPIPTYGLFVYEPEKLGATVEFIELKEEDNFKINLNELREKIIEINDDLKKKYCHLNYVPRVVAIYNQNPNNPLGVSLGKNQKNYLYDFVRLCDEFKVLIIDDLVYRDLVYDNKNIAFPLATFDKYKDNIISLFGISKSFSLAGIRVGFALGNKYIIQDMRDNLFLQMDSVSIISQLALISVFNNNKKRVKYRNKYLDELKVKYLENLDIIKYFICGSNYVSKKSKKRIEKRLTKEEIELYKNGIELVSIYKNLIPESGFFILLDFTKMKGKRINDKKINNDIDLVIELYKKEKIKFLPGSSFGLNDEEQIIGRITFSKPWDILFDDMKTLAKILINIK